MKNVFLFSLVIIVFASGCREMTGRRVRGSGEIKTEARTVSTFNSIDVSGAIDVYVKQDSVSSVKVVADDNILEYIEVHTEGSSLEIYTEGNVRLRPSEKIKVYVSNPQYKEFQVSGASSIRGENQVTSTGSVHIGISGAGEGKLEIDAPKVSIDLSGASSVSVRGRTKDFEAGASGASKIRCFDLLTENTNVDVSGASHAEVYASVSLAGEASGASSVDHKGSATVNVNRSGASSVNKKD